MGALSEHRYGVDEFEAMLASEACPFDARRYVLPQWLFEHEAITGDVRAMRHAVWFLRRKGARPF